MEAKSDKKLVISPKKFKPDTTTILSARVPTDLMKRIEDLAKKTRRNRNEMVLLLLSFAVDNVIVTDEEGDLDNGND